jgi:hypothetical protein
MKFLHWLFIPHRVFATEAPPKILIKIGGYGLGYNPKPFRAYRPSGLSPQDLQYHSFLHHHVRFFKCKICGIGCWGYGQQEYCGSWSCFRRLK